MIILFTHEKRLEVLPSNPIYEQLIEFDGKFLGVTLVQEEEVVEVVEEEELVEVEVDTERFLAGIEEMFSPKSITYTLLYSHVSSCLSSTGKLKITKDSENSTYKIGRASAGTLVVPERFLK